MNFKFGELAEHSFQDVIKGGEFQGLNPVSIHSSVR
uniref:Uncharacterized protein n=1 Tax=Anguilla anguilla TaxID=7936 RepID=A0A0E9V554_ANGAN